MTIGDDLAADFELILQEKGKAFFVIKQTDTIDGMGNVIDVSEETTYFYAIEMDISKKDRKIHDMGLAVTGNKILYVKPSYDIKSAGVIISSIVIKEDDVIKDEDDQKWRVLKIIHEPYGADTQVYKKVVIQSIGLGGSL